MVKGPPFADAMSNFNLDSANPEHVRAYMDEQPWVQHFKLQTGKHPVDLGITDEGAAKAHLTTAGQMKVAQARPISPMDLQRGEFDDQDRARGDLQRAGIRETKQRPAPAGRVQPFTNSNVRGSDAGATGDAVLDAKKSGFFNR